MSLGHNKKTCHPASGDAFFEFCRVSFSYHRQKPFIRDLSFAVRNGEFIGLLGANASGKSTIMKLASGLVKSSQGQVNLWGRPVQLHNLRDRAKLLSYLPQILDMNIPFTVKQLVSMGLYPYEEPPSLTVDAALEMVGLAGKRDSYMANLSGGEKRRAYIAMTLVQGAGLLLLDEPLANLDVRYQLELLRLLKNLQKTRDIAVVMALHDINIALQFEKIMLIREGTILGFGGPDEVLTKDLLKQAFDVDIEVKRHDAAGAFISYTMRDNHADG